jgi:hypothetical protein
MAENPENLVTAADVAPEDGARAGAEPEPCVEEIPEDQEIDFVTLGMFIIGGLASLRCHS